MWKTKTAIWSSKNKDYYGLTVVLRGDQSVARHLPLMVLYLPQQLSQHPMDMWGGNEVVGFQWALSCCIFSAKNAAYPSTHILPCVCFCECVRACRGAGTWWATRMISLLFRCHPSTRNRDNDSTETLEPRNFTSDQLFKTVMTAFMQVCVCVCVCESFRV